MHCTFLVLLSALFNADCCVSTTLHFLVFLVSFVLPLATVWKASQWNFSLAIYCVLWTPAVAIFAHFFFIDLFIYFTISGFSVPFYSDACIS